MGNSSLTHPTTSNLNNAKSDLAKLAKRFGLDAKIAQSKSEKNLFQRAKTHSLFAETLRQDNLENIVEHAFKDCSVDQVSESLDPDWINAFWSMAAQVHNPKMQSLWGKILSMEIANPASFSVKSLSVLKLLTQREASTFQHACDLSSVIGADNNHKVIVAAHRPSAKFGLSRALVSKLKLGQYRLSYHQILQLADLGLLYERELESSINDGEIRIHQGDLLYQLRPRQRHCKLSYYRFTPVGDELAALIKASPHTEYRSAFAQMLGHFFEVDSQT
ncbi:TIGR03899 family protein [Alginatibacterium sediminis]|uniref:TIGR03899 family protein n=1 Tax=Alginatibacterium sediminis TaxID=2164068 RepID=A0A420E959_9ALTE|nr:TIGR03899 family protein [Alginatibacterium sediminis]RKF15868.1 TIGR03899 family protein [Alginatibacterium sediminis]